MLADIETFQETLAATGLPPVLSGRHAVGEFRAGVVARGLGPLKVIELVTPEGECFRDRWRDDRWVVAALGNARLLSLETMQFLESTAAG